MLRNCLVCGKEIDTCPSWNTRYCSRECAAKSMMRRHVITCQMCGKEIDVPNSSTQRFCSRKCSDSYKKAFYVPHLVEKLCPVCGKHFSVTPSTIQTFCSRECAYKGRTPSGVYNLSQEGRIKKSEVMRYQMTHDTKLRAAVIGRMKNNNPAKNPEVVEKIKQKMKGKYKNNFKYGNGKVSPYEQKVMESLLPLGFIYNHAISTAAIRKAYPSENYAINYKPDFVNLSTKLCIEIDGDDHKLASQQLLDKKKESCLSFLGYTTIRFTHEDIDEGRFDEWLSSYQKEQ